ncbi:hypothetical protein FB390_5599 [Nocardia bhagyanarayanae]|uniref:Uncharacterized protein n=1 Tax=Nocardia bhagyanarayanae TaxID=1215925 RepID=A0A543EV63_9NOCA|nr:hypothetical protein FB390_5599 [Nocardia bhagyanarayanae]
MTTYGILVFDDAEELDFAGPWGGPSHPPSPESALARDHSVGDDHARVDRDLPDRRGLSVFR